jgi:L-iditol 2-dehydrogenase
MYLLAQVPEGRPKDIGQHGLLFVSELQIHAESVAAYDSPEMTAAAAIPTRSLCAVWHGVGDLRLEEQPLPPLGATDVLVEIAACGICATDLHLLDGSVPLYKPPKVLGHEMAGTVRALGSGVTNVGLGDAVALDTSVGCGSCAYCHEGYPFACQARTSVAAGFAQFTVVPRTVVYRLPRGVDPARGALAEPLSCALHAVARGGVGAASSVAIVGAGALGLLVLQVARLCGATEVVVSDPDPARRQLAARLGATVTVDPGDDDLKAKADQLGDGRGVDVAFEAVGAEATIEQAIALPRFGGTVVLVGVAPATARPRFSAYDLFLRELTIRASYIRRTEFGRAVDLLGVLDLEPLITHRFGLKDVHAAVQAARSRAGIRVLVGGVD